MPKPATGKCLCGSVGVAFTYANDHFYACHCGMCRRWGGGPALTVDTSNDLRFSGEEFISVFNSSDWAERGFCKQCGTHLFYRVKESGFTNISLGILDNSEHLKFHSQIFIDKKPKHYHFSEQTETLTEREVQEKYSIPKI
ncbi:GFA family protein [Peredibacter sp. HCB2-198]|uniref:GFA family protein n=1 Tax=Peredibacter sp. HCB2-198 TaxID=3383025 RepID=UPI0038B528FB